MLLFLFFAVLALLVLITNRTDGWPVLALALALAPLVAFAQDVSAVLPFLPESVAKPVTIGLALVPIAQAVARLMASAGLAVNGKRSGSGSGWFKFWTLIARFPGHGDDPATAP